MKNKILKAISVMAACAGSFAACALDSEGYTAFIVFIICAAWLALMAYANKGRF